MQNNFSNEITELLKQGKSIAETLRSRELTPACLLLAMSKLKDSGYSLLNAIITTENLDQMFIDLESSLYDSKAEVEIESIFSVSALTNRIVKLSSLEARILKSESVESLHILLALFHNSEIQSMNFIQPFINAGATYKALHQAAMHEDKTPMASLVEEPSSDDDASKHDDSGAQTQRQKRQQSRFKGSTSDTPMLDKFGNDMTLAASEKRLDPVIGREVEIERLAQILSRRKKNNPVLIGEPGVGKSAIVEGLALRIIERKVPRVLFDKRVISLDMASIVAGTKYRGEFEERIKAILDELSKKTNIILFIDEIHTIVGAGNPQGSMDAANMLKPALARGALQCIGATTLDEYRKNIEKDGALERRFQKVMVEPTTAEETLTILNNIKDKYESHHNVTYTDDALKACVRLTERYISDRNFPDKAIDAMDEAGSRVHITNVSVPEEIESLEKELDLATKNKFDAASSQDFERAATWRDRAQKLSEDLEKAKRRWEENVKNSREIVDEEKVAEVVAMMTGVPVQRVAQTEGRRLLEMGPTLKKAIIGQDEAITKIVKAIQRNRIGLKDPNKPIGTFLFLGPTGVGKTHLAKKLAQYMFDSTEALIRIDMSEFMEKFTVSRLVGAPPGYVGYEEGGQLTEKVRRHPYSIVLLDEIEKAHPDVFNLLLQVMDEGRLTDSLGRHIDFKNTIIIMTSNVGTRQLKEFGTGVGFTTPEVGDKEYNHNVLKKALNKAFSPEFLNRIDDIVMFDALDRDAIFKIIDIELEGLFKRVTDLGYILNLSDKAKDFIADKGYDSQFGARPLKRAIQKYLEDELAEQIIGREIIEGTTINVDYDAEQDRIVTTLSLPE
jgi:ATP-dependent Clp protease ATP-binding subunit ClpC